PAAVTIAIARRVVLLPPLPGGIAHTTAVGLVLGTHPYDIRLRRNFIAARDPLIALVIPIPGTFDPDMGRRRRSWTTLHHHRRRCLLHDDVLRLGFGINHLGLLNVVRPRLHIHAILARPAAYKNVAPDKAKAHNT